MLILYFYVFQRGFEVLNATFQASVYVTIVKQPPEVFYVKRCSWKFEKIYRETPVSESLF